MNFRIWLIRQFPNRFTYHSQLLYINFVQDHLTTFDETLIVHQQNNKLEN